MATRFDIEGVYADQAAHKHQRGRDTSEGMDAIIDLCPPEDLVDRELERRPNAVGNPAYPALGMFKTLLLQSWYALSGRELSDKLEDRISSSHFCGFSLAHEVSEYSTTCRFRNQLLAKDLTRPLLGMTTAQIQAGIIVDASRKLINSLKRLTIYTASCTRPLATDLCQKPSVW